MMTTALITGSLYAGYLFVKKYNKSNSNKGLAWHYDTSYSTPNIPLYHSTAESRDKMISNVKYEVFLVLSQGDTYEGRLNLEFRLGDKSIEDLFLDFQGIGISELTVNDHLISPSSVIFENHKVYLPKYDLKSNQKNNISVKFQNAYVTDSTGFHRYQDPADNNLYFYTHLEPFFCNKWFPCFDQPSIRAPFTLRVVLPDRKWQAISNENVLQNLSIQEEIGKSLLKQFNIDDIVERLLGADHEGNLLLFDTSPPISTYIYALAVGSYCQFTNETDYHVPMKIFCRKSKAKYADPIEKFRCMEYAINFFEQFFSCPFPFKKYEMVFAPEFRISGMENVGIVILRDTFLRPDEEKNYFEFMFWHKVSVHELSHMWFGDLVTMKWWNDLWLKESFAEYCTCLCLEECPDFSFVKNPQQIGQHFLTEALIDDTTKTTHPIQVTVNHTNDAINVFDKICYRKGAAFLRQIDHFVGRDIMQEGIRIYFREFKFQNTTLQDFINCLQQSLDKKQKPINLQEWVDSWLTKSGVNEVTAVINEKNDNAFTLKVQQSFPRQGDQVYHEQIIDVAIYDQNCSQSIISNIHLLPQQFTQIIDNLQSKPEAVLINANNKGYCRTVLDYDSLMFFLRNLQNVKDDQNRSLIWRILCDNLKIKVLTGEQFIQAVIDHILTETEEYTMPTVFQTAQFVRKYTLTNQDVKHKLLKQLEDVYLKKLAIEGTKSLQVLILNELIAILTDVQSAIKWFENSKIVLRNGKEIELMKTERYGLLRVIFESDLPIQKKQQYLFKEKEIDFSDFDVMEELGVLASIPDTESKLQLWDSYIKGTNFNVKKIEASAKYFYNYKNIQQCEQFADMFYQSVESVFAMMHRDYAMQWFNNLSPTFLRREGDYQKLKEIYERQKMSENTNFTILLSNELELFELLLN